MTWPRRRPSRWSRPATPSRMTDRSVADLLLGHIRLLPVGVAEPTANASPRRVGLIRLPAGVVIGLDDIVPAPAAADECHVLIPLDDVYQLRPGCESGS